MEAAARDRARFSCRPDLLLSSSLGLLRCSEEEEFDTIIGQVDVNIDFIRKAFMVCSCYLSIFIAVLERAYLQLDGKIDWSVLSLSID